MLESEKLAIATHLHVLLRRKTGRVTDTEWMAVNADYAREIMRFARASAKEDGHADLAEWADKLEHALDLDGTAAKDPSRRHAVAPPFFAPPVVSPVPAETSEAPRYVRGIR